MKKLILVFLSCSSLASQSQLVHFERLLYTKKDEIRVSLELPDSLDRTKITVFTDMDDVDPVHSVRTDTLLSLEVLSASGIYNYRFHFPDMDRFYQVPVFPNTTAQLAVNVLERIGIKIDKPKQAVIQLFTDMLEYIRQKDTLSCFSGASAKPFCWLFALKLYEAGNSCIAVQTQYTFDGNADSARAYVYKIASAVTSDKDFLKLFRVLLGCPSPLPSPLPVPEDIFGDMLQRSGEPKISIRAGHAGTLTLLLQAK